jgi:DNA-binding YbaB/EbfC family protein
VPNPRVPPGAQPNMQQIMKQAQQMQAQLQAAQEEIAAAQLTGSAGAGLVTATVTGGLELVRIDIQPAAVDPDDVETLADLVVAAVRDAQRAAQELQQERLGGLPGLPGGLPGLG